MGIVNTSRNPEFKFQYFTDAPLLGDLIALFNADQPHIAPVIDGELDAMIARNRPLAAPVLDFLGIEHPVNDDAPPKHRGHAQARGPLVRYLFGTKAIARAAEKWIPAELRKLIREKFLVKQVPKPEIEPEAREFLLEYYADDVRRLSELLGRPLPWRNFQDFR